ncbi:MAG: MoaD/ThiS family protein [Dehalococcoidia bacterium]
MVETADQGMAPTVTVEAVSWVTRFVGGDGSSRVNIPEPLAADDTALSVLRRISRRYPDLARMLWTPAGDLAEHVQVMINNAIAGPEEVVAHRLRPGDTVSLLGQYMGG